MSKQVLARHNERSNMCFINKQLQVCAKQKNRNQEHSLHSPVAQIDTKCMENGYNNYVTYRCLKGLEGNLLKSILYKASKWFLLPSKCDRI